MEALKKAIQEYGVGIGTDIVKVDSFLNHRIDTALCTEMGKEIAAYFSDTQVDCVLTVEASGIAIAMTAAQAFGNVPVVFAKKGSTANQGNDVYTAQVYSFTHKKMNTIRVSRKYLTAGMKVVIVDDFLANGEAIEGLRDILRQAGCELVGCAVEVEKGFQPGGQKLRDEGIRVLSLAIVDSIDNGRIILRGE